MTKHKYKKVNKQHRLHLDTVVYVFESYILSSNPSFETTYINGIKKSHEGQVMYSIANNSHRTLYASGYGKNWTTSLTTAQNISKSRRAERERSRIKLDQKDARSAELDVYVKTVLKDLLNKEVQVKDGNAPGGYVKSYIDKVGHYGTKKSIYIKAYNVENQYPLRNENKTWYYNTLYNQQQDIVNTINKEVDKLKAQLKEKIAEQVKETQKLRSMEDNK